jgi:hypothetical protein
MLMQPEIHMTEQLLSERRSFEVEIATEEVEVYKPPGKDQIPPEFFKAGCNGLRSEIHKICLSACSKEEFSEQCGRNLLLYVPNCGSCG